MEAIFQVRRRSWRQNIPSNIDDNSATSNCSSRQLAWSLRTLLTCLQALVHKLDLEPYLAKEEIRRGLKVSCPMPT